MLFAKILPLNPLKLKEKNDKESDEEIIFKDGEIKIYREIAENLFEDVDKVEQNRVKEKYRLENQKKLGQYIESNILKSLNYCNKQKEI